MTQETLPFAITVVIPREHSLLFYGAQATFGRFFTRRDDVHQSPWLAVNPTSGMSVYHDFFSALAFDDSKNEAWRTRKFVIKENINDSAWTIASDAMPASVGTEAERLKAAGYISDFELHPGTMSYRQFKQRKSSHTYHM